MTTAIASDPVRFAQNVLGRNLYYYQRDVLSDHHKYRVMCSGRQTGKSEVLAEIAVHAAATNRNIVVYIISGGEKSAEKLLAKCANLARNAGLGASFVDDNRNLLSFTNKSTIEAVPTSEARIRGETINLLIIDEAGLVPNEIWDAAEPTLTAAKPFARTVISGTPWRGQGHWFHDLYRRGEEPDNPVVKSFHWTCWDRPDADVATLKEIKKSKATDVFEREYEAKWSAEVGSFLTSEELDAVTVDYKYTSEADELPFTNQPRGGYVTAGIDWGFRRDLNTLACVSALLDDQLNGHRGDDVIYFLAHMEGRESFAYQDWCNRILDVGTHYAYSQLVAELNGVGEPAYQALRATRRPNVLRPCNLASEFTTSKTKTDNYGALKLMIQKKQLLLPQGCGELRRQLNSLQFEQLSNHNIKIEVPSNIGHDDYADALALAVGHIPIHAARVYRDTSPSIRDPYWINQRILELADGTAIPEYPQSRENNKIMRWVKPPTYKGMKG